MEVKKEKFALGIILLCIGVYALFMSIIIVDGYGLSDPFSIAVLSGGFLSLALGLTVAIIGAAGK